MEQPVSKFSLEFREIMVKIIHDDFYQKNQTTTFDAIVLNGRYRTLIDNINGFIVVGNYTIGMYEYISNGVYSHLGYDLLNKSKEELTDFMIGIIKDDHRDFMNNTVFPTVLAYLKEHATRETGTDYRYTLCLQLKNVYGTFLWFLIDTVFIEIDASGFPIRSLITCTNINQIKRDDFVYYNITKKNSDGMYEVVLEGNADKKITDLKLTPREVQIINLISRGDTNKDISSKLSISLNTVQTHRKNILKKTGCTGTAELTNFAFARGLL